MRRARPSPGRGLVGDLVTMLVNVEIRGSGAVKIAEVVEALAGEDLPHRAVRVALGAWKDGAIASPIELDAVRRPKEAPQAEPGAPASDGPLAVGDELHTPATFDEAVT